MVHAVAAYTQSPSDEASLGVFNPTPPPPPTWMGSQCIGEEPWHFSMFPQVPMFTPRGKRWGE